VTEAEQSGKQIVQHKMQPATMIKQARPAANCMQEL